MVEVEGGGELRDAQGFRRAAAAVLLIVACVPLPSCAGRSADAGETSGPPYTEPDAIALSSFDAAAAEGSNGALIDTSHAALGYVGASAQSTSRLKFQVVKGDMSYSYDHPDHLRAQHGRWCL